MHRPHTHTHTHAYAPCHKEGGKENRQIAEGENAARKGKKYLVNPLIAWKAGKHTHTIF